MSNYSESLKDAPIEIIQIINQDNRDSKKVETGLISASENIFILFLMR